MELESEHAEFLGSHQFGVLSTGRRDGSSQSSLIGYLWDGTELVTTFRATSAKYHNVGRQPLVAFVVQDGRRALTLYGEGRLVEHDPERAESFGKILEAYGMPAQTPDELTATLDAERRVVLRVTPTHSDLHE